MPLFLLLLECMLIRHGLCFSCASSNRIVRLSGNQGNLYIVTRMRPMRHGEHASSRAIGFEEDMVTPGVNSGVFLLATSTTRSINGGNDQRLVVYVGKMPLDPGSQ